MAESQDYQASLKITWQAGQGPRELMLSRAGSRAQVSASPSRLPFREECLDRIVAVEQAPAKDASHVSLALREWYRVLRNGANLIIDTTDPEGIKEALYLAEFVIQSSQVSGDRTRFRAYKAARSLMKLIRQAHERHHAPRGSKNEVGYEGGDLFGRD